MTSPRWLPTAPVAASCLFLAAWVHSGRETREASLCLFGLGVFLVAVAVLEATESRSRGWLVHSGHSAGARCASVDAGVASAAKPPRLWLVILLPSAALSAAWLLCIALGAGATAKAFVLFGISGMMALYAVAEVIERREGRRRSVCSASSPETRLLVLALDNGERICASILDAGRFAPTHVRALQKPVNVRDVGLDRPCGVGLWVWEGRVLPPLAIDDECMPDIGPEWIGTWRRATPNELQRFACGMRVWDKEDSHAHL